MNPATGTFTQEDTYQGNIYDALSLHKYLYAQDNPVIYKDPTGNDVSFVGLLTTVGSWAMETARIIWSAIKAIKAIVTWEAISAICTVRSLIDQIKGLLTAKTWEEGFDSFFSLILTVLGVFSDCYTLSHTFQIIFDFSGLAIDLLKFMINLFEGNKKGLRKNIVDLIFDSLSLLADSNIKFKKLIEEQKRKYQRNEKQWALIDLAKRIKELEVVPESVIDRLFELAKKYDSFDDIFIVLFHT